MTIKAYRVASQHDREISQYRIYDLPPRPGQTGWVGTIWAANAKAAIALWRKQRQGKTE